MENTEKLRQMMDEGLSKAKYLMVVVAPGVWIDCDDFREDEGGILFMRKGHSSGFVSKEVFEKLEWKRPEPLMSKEVNQ